jgi:transposase
MFIRRKRNKSGTISIYILEKRNGRQELIKSFGSASNESEIIALEEKARKEIIKLTNQSVFDFEYSADKDHIENLKKSISKVRIVGTELVLNKLFDEIGFNKIPGKLFRHLVLSRIVYPGSKLRTIEYLSRHHQEHYSVNSVYRYMDKLQDSYKEELQEISYKHTLELLGGVISVVFYDVTTLYFEISREDELRKIGYSKDGKSHNPQIVLGLLVSKYGYPLAFEMYEGNKYEGYTFIPVLNKFKEMFNILNLIVIADSGLMSKSNIDNLKKNNYDFIIGARIKNESAQIKNDIISREWKKEKIQFFKKQDGINLIVSYSEKRSKKDKLNRKKGIERLRSKINSGKLSKQNINNRGYNKFLKIEGEATVSLDLSKAEEDEKWDGLKGYLTNTNLKPKQVIESYHELWHIERAFRMSKTDLKVRPIYHQKSKRIESHLIISFCSYKIYKELERQLKVRKSIISPEKAIDILKSIYGIKTILPVSGKYQEIIMANTDEQKNILDLFDIKY